jgi:hypothetical protein
MRADIQALLTEGREIFAALERETHCCLGNLETMPAEEIELFNVERGVLVQALAAYAARFRECLEHAVHDGETAAINVLDSLKQELSGALQRIVESDGVLLALAEQRLSILRNEMTAIAKGRKALSSYRGRERRVTAGLDQTA